MARCRSGSSSWLWGEGLALTDSDITSLSVSYLPYGPPNQTTSCYPGRRPTIGQWPPITTRKCSVNNKQDVALSQHRLTTPKTHTYLHTHILTLRITNIVFSWIRHFRAARVYINPSWVINFNLNFKLKLSGSVIIFCSEDYQTLGITPIYT